MSGFWNDPSVKPGGSEYMRFEKVGDSIEGTVAKLGKRVFNEGTADERIAVELTFVEEDVPVLTAGQVLLMRALYEFKPEPGDWVKVTLSGIERKGNKTLKLFAVDVKRQDGSTQSVDQAA